MIHRKFSVWHQQDLPLTIQDPYLSPYLPTVLDISSFDRCRVAMSAKVIGMVTKAELKGQLDRESC